MKVGTKVSQCRNGSTYGIDNATDVRLAGTPNDKKLTFNMCTPIALPGPLE